MSPELSEQRIDAGSIALNCGVGPDNGPPLILLHGAMVFWQDWLPITESLTKSFRVIAPDLRGCGGSDHTPGHYEAVEFTPDIEHLISDFVGEPAYVVGHSLGGLVALDLVARAPDLIRRAVIEDPPLFLAEWYDSWWGAPLAGIAIQLIDAGKSESEMAATLEAIAGDATRAAFLARAFANSDPGIIRTIAGESHLFGGYDATALVAELRVPTLLLHGDHALGGVMRDEDIERVRRVENDSLVIEGVPGIGHAIHATATDQFVRRVGAFFESNR